VLFSGFTKIEWLPKPIYCNNAREVELIESLFSRAEYIPFDEIVLNIAFDAAKLYGLNAIDALHVASAYIGKADEMIYTEKPTKPLYRIPPYELRIVPLHYGILLKFDTDYLKI
jgi:hypothetical protein